MFLTQGQVERGHLTNNRYGTAGTTTTTTLASQGGLLINIDSATGGIVNTASNSFIESNEALGMWFVAGLGGTRGASVDNTELHNGHKTLNVYSKIASYALVNLAANGTNLTAGTQGRGIPVKPSTKYKLTCPMKALVNSGTPTIYVEVKTFTSTFTSAGNTGIAGVSTTTDWFNGTLIYTTSASAAYLTFAPIISAGAAHDSYGWFSLMEATVEEVVEPVANSLTSSSPSLVSFTAVGSTDNIDQSQLTFTNAFGVGSGAGVNYIGSQSFTATKSKHTGVILYKKANVGTPTGNFKVEVRTDNAGDPSTTVLASYTMPLATYNALTANADFTVNLPCNITAGTKYHYVISNTATETGTNNFQIGANTAGGYTGGDNRQSTNGGTTWSVNGTADLYFKTLYYKPTTNFKASQNNQSVSISADEDGFLNTGVHSLTTGVYSFSQTNDTSLAMGAAYSWLPNIYSYTTTTTSGTSNIMYKGGTDMALKGAVAGTVVCTYKVPVTLISSLTAAGTARYAKVEYSHDNASWNTIIDNTGALSYLPYSQTITPSTSFIYIKFTSGNGANSAIIGNSTQQFSITGTIDTSSLSTLRNYPTNKDIMSQYSTTLGSPTTTATYRATKWGFPAIEYSATEYQFLDVDTTATGSTVAFSELGTSYTTVADGASIAITSTTNPNIFVKANITANRLYLSSNDYVASSDKDGSLKQSVVYSVIQ